MFLPGTCSIFGPACPQSEFKKRRILRFLGLLIYGRNPAWMIYGQKNGQRPVQSGSPKRLGEKPKTLGETLGEKAC
jgi:hypothetical protein